VKKHLGIFALAFVFYMANVLFLALFYRDVEWMWTTSWIIDHTYQVFVTLYIFFSSKHRDIKLVSGYWAMVSVVRLSYTLAAAKGLIPLISEKYSYVFLLVLLILGVIYLGINTIQIKNKTILQHIKQLKWQDWEFIVFFNGCIVKLKSLSGVYYVTLQIYLKRQLGIYLPKVKAVYYSLLRYFSYVAGFIITEKRKWLKSRNWGRKKEK